MSAETFEKVKIELRSILLSSKYGVAASDIQNDYEQLSCQRLPYKELGFSNVQSLMRAMPDVAKEVRSPNGEITYHAVCDESTAHIQKLVQNQTTKKKRMKHPVMRGRGRGGFSRGGYDLGRGGHSFGGRNNMDRNTSPLYTKPRAPLLSITSQDSRTPLHSRNFVHSRTPIISKVPLLSRFGQIIRIPRVNPLASARSCDNESETFRSGVKDHLIRGDSWDVSETDVDAKHSRTSRAIFGRGTTELSSSQSDRDTDHPEQIISPIHNFKIGVNETGKRVISKTGNFLGKVGDAGDSNAHNADTSNVHFDLRDVLNRRRVHHASADNHEEKDYDNGEKDFGRMNLNSDTVKRVMNENRVANPRNLPPRLLRKQQEQDNQVFKPMQARVVPHTHFSEQNTVYSMEKNNWVPPIDGELYLQAYYNFFAQKGMAAPQIEIIPGKLKKEPGYYGQLLYQDMHYYPLEIMRSEELARQNVARAFCLKNEIPLAPEEHVQVKPEQNQFSSSVNTIPLNVKNTPSKVNDTPLRLNGTPSRLNDTSSGPNNTSQRVQEVIGVVEANITRFQQEAKSSQISQGSSNLLQNGDFPEILEKVYKMLKPNGVWVSVLEKMYESTYAEPLNMDFLSVAGQWPDYFTLEQLAPNRYIVYPVPDALTKKPVVNDDISEETIEDVTPTSVPVPPALLPPVGSKLQVLFSFAYSPVDMYVQTADMENLVYEIDEVLNQNCPKFSPPELDAVTVNSMMAAIYVESWYRTQVVEIDKEVVSVYFIDYGNREKVSVADLRPVPREQLVLETSSLAIRFALRKSKAGDWCEDVTSILAELSEIHPFLSAMILEHKDDQCIVDLYTPEGNLVNDMLIQPAPTTPIQKVKPFLQRTESTEKGKDQSVKNSPVAVGVKLFADDPEPLVIPDCDTFAVYICRVMSENSVLLRIVDDEYSEKLDELEQKIAEYFYSWPIPKQIKHSNIYAGMVLAGAEDAEDVEYDEEGKEKLSDQNKYYRIRVLKENKDGSCDCYLPDHGHNEVLNRSELREIDPHLNLSLSYQAVMAKLHGLDKLPDKLKPMAVRLLIKLLTNGATFFAVKAGKSSEKKDDDIVNINADITNRVRKIISCMRDIEPKNVAKIYLSVYGEPVDNVEEVIKNIPGYGYWRESLEVNLFDTSQEDSDVNINESVLAFIEDIEKVQSQGGSAEDVWRDRFSSNTSQADTDSGSLQGGSDSSAGKERLPDALNKLDAGGNGTDDEAKLSRVRSYVQDLTSSTSHDDSITSTSSRTLYTWNTKPETTNGEVPSSQTPSATPPSLSDNNSLPKCWNYPLLKFVSLQIVRVENPSDFVAIPMEQRGALEKLEAAIAQCFSANPAEPASSFLNDVLYTVKSGSVYQRALYLNLVGSVVRVFFPDHHSYDTVPTSELFLLPKQFYSLPFLARRMRLGGVVPTGQDWPTHVIKWFKATFCNKCLYALVTGEEGSSSDRHIPKTLVVRLIDTSGSEDLVVEEYMVSQGMATCEPQTN